MVNPPRLALVAALTISAAPRLFAAPPAKTDTAHATMVHPDRVMIGPEYIPRRLDLPTKLIVPSGRTVELPEDATFDYIEVAGTLRVSRAHDTVVRFTHLINLPGGTIDIGTEADPIPCGRRVELVIRDVPIDADKDPFQWGNGLVNFGRQTRVGCRKTAFVETAEGIPADATDIRLASAPSNWHVGDELLIPDTAPSRSGPRRENRVTISAIDGATVTLSKALDFAHPEITDPNGKIVLRPRVANLTRNILIRSEHEPGPGVTRGHTADIGIGATWDIRYNEFIALGRTLDIPFDDSMPGMHVGTNQRAKYVEHHHHAGSSVGSADVGNVYLGNRATTKWALVVHGTSDTLVEENVAVDFPGAGFVTEDGYEVRNVFRRNLAAYIGGDPKYASGFTGRQNVEAECPGCEGSGYWFRGVMNTFDRNEAWNCYRGMNLFNQQQLDGQFPSVPGGMPDTSNVKRVMLPIAMTGNVVAANAFLGLEFWAVRKFPNVDLISAYNVYEQVHGVQSDGLDHLYVNPTIVCAPGAAALGIHTSFAYTTSFEVQGGYIGGCSAGVTGGGGRFYERFKGTTLQNAVNVDQIPASALFENVMHLPLGNLPHRFILMDSQNFNIQGDPGFIWNGTDPLPRVGDSLWTQQRGSQVIVKNWQGTGKDYRLLYLQQLESNPAWYSAKHQHALNCPVKGLTMLECWQQFGLSYGGDVLRKSESVDLDGVVYGKARAGLGVSFSPPRAIVTFPTMREPALGPDGRHPSVTGYVTIDAILTGNPDAATDVMLVSVDGEPPHPVPGDAENGRPDVRVFNTTHAAPGVHTVTVWRMKKDGSAMVPASEYTSQYFVEPVDAAASKQQK